MVKLKSQLITYQNLQNIFPSKIPHSSSTCIKGNMALNSPIPTISSNTYHDKKFNHISSYYDIALFQIVILTNKYIKKLQTSLNYDDALNRLEIKAVNDKLALCPLRMVGSNRKTVTLIDTQPKGVKPASV